MKAIVTVVALIFGIGLVCMTGNLVSADVPESPTSLWPKEADKQVDEAKKLLTGDVSDLASANNLVRQLAYSDLVGRQRDMIDKLMRIADEKKADKSFEGPFHYAVQALGMLRAVDAVSLLSENLCYLPSGVITGGSGVYESYFPCALSLVQIGQPSIGSMMAILEHSDDPLKRRLAAWVILTVEGKDQVQHRVSDKTKETSDHAVKDRLRNAAQYLESYKPDLTNPYLEKILKQGKDEKASPAKQIEAGK